MKQINHLQLKNLITICYNQLNPINSLKIPIILYGSFGIGKSFVIKDTSKEIAKVKKKDFLEWNKLDKNQKLELINNPENKFVLIDIRLSEYDSSDIKGLPDFHEDSIIWKSSLWCKLLTNPKSDGILLFDEFYLIGLRVNYKLLFLVPYKRRKVYKPSFNRLGMEQIKQLDKNKITELNNIEEISFNRWNDITSIISSNQFEDGI